MCWWLPAELQSLRERIRTYRKHFVNRVDNKGNSHERNNGHKLGANQIKTLKHKDLMVGASSMLLVHSIDSCS